MTCSIRSRIARCERTCHSMGIEVSIAAQTAVCANHVRESTAKGSQKLATWAATVWIVQGF